MNMKIRKSREIWIKMRATLGVRVMVRMRI